MHFGENEWKISNAPKDYIEQMLENIISFNFDVKKVLAKNKVSQNREDADYASVIDVMKDDNKNFLLNTMKRIKCID